MFDAMASYVWPQYHCGKRITFSSIILCLLQINDGCHKDDCT